MMSGFLSGHSCGDNAERLVEACLSQIGEIPAVANFGFVYATDVLSMEFHSIVDQLKQRTGITHWTGTIGIGVTTTGQEYYDQSALVVMIASFPDNAFRTIPLQKSNIDGFVTEARQWYHTGHAHFGILHGDPSNPVTPALMDGLAKEVPGAFFVGGLTSSNNLNLQVADNVSSGGVSGVLFSSDVPVAAGHTQGCTPIGGKHTITRSERNIIIELDRQPALDVFNEDIGEILAKNLNRVVGYIFVGFPVLGSDTGDYMVRNLVGLDPGQKLVAVGEILSEGDEIMFCRRDGQTARDDMLRMLADLKKRVPEPPRGGVYYSCLGRGRYQFGENSEELKLIRDELGDFPLAGFFANGEIFHNRLYGYTGVLTLFC
jgi:small ligand-binding sensory domain FIST